MLPKHFKRDDCRLCGGSDLSKVLCLTPTPPANALVAEEELSSEQQVYPLDLYFCGDCGHVQLLDVIDPSELFANYVYVSGTSPVFVRHFEEYANEVVEQTKPPKGALAIDIGSNDGTLLKCFKNRGLSVLGVDPAESIASHATADGIPTLPSFFDLNLAEKIRADYGPAAIVTANNVFAHADDLAGILNGVIHLLDDDGVFIFEVSYLGDVLEKTLFDTIYHEHLAYHSVSPLVTFLKQNGMEMIRVRRTSSHGGSIRCVAQSFGAAGRPDESVDEIMAWEHSHGLLEKSTFIDFAGRIDRVKSSLTDLLSSIVARGESIAGFGAPAKATTLMYHFGIGPENIGYIVDDSPLKVGLFTPGLHIPVKPTEFIYQDRPDNLLILAWNFAESIMQNHRKFREEGGRFIVPLPEITII